MDVQDMADLIYIRDAYKSLNESLFGAEVTLVFYEGYMGALGRVFRVIERNVSDRWKKDDDGAMRILDDTSLTAEERATMLLEE